MTAKQREVLSKGLIELANIIGGALVFGQLVSAKFDFIVFLLGTIFAMTFYSWAIALVDN
jgi:hypothetical protein